MPKNLKDPNLNVLNAMLIEQSKISNYKLSVKRNPTLSYKKTSLVTETKSRNCSRPSMNCNLAKVRNDSQHDEQTENYAKNARKH